MCIKIPVMEALGSSYCNDCSDNELFPPQQKTYHQMRYKFKQLTSNNKYVAHIGPNPTWQIIPEAKRK